MTQENKQLLALYLSALLVAGALFFLIINVEKWFNPLDIDSQSGEKGPSALLEQKDLNFGLFDDDTFKNLQPVLSDKDIRDIEEEFAEEDREKPVADSGSKVRYSNPFLPFY
ncbi:MAG: hypothetical protein QY321_00875 [Patescibacteria group bacterium]|nr:MAG: hypothetical protein QY321_00875 [Patescibacteria group bacterium]